MRVVIDSNCLRSDELRRFLAARRTNRAILTDYASIEAYKNNPVVTIEQSMKVLGEFPKQVVILRNTGDVAGLDPSTKKYASRMVWDEETRTFPLFVRSIQQLRWAEPNVTSMALRLGQKAQEEMERFADGQGLLSFHKKTAEIFSADELAQIRSTKPIGGPLLNLILINAVNVTLLLLPEVNTFRGLSHWAALNHFVLRLSLARILSSLAWIRNGRPNNLKHDRLRNDAIDCIFATYGSYFNGIMTNDKRLRTLHNELRQTLRSAARQRPGSIILPKPYQSKLLGT